MQVRTLPALLGDTYQTYPLTVIRLHRNHGPTGGGEDVRRHLEPRSPVAYHLQCSRWQEPVYLMPLLDQGDSTALYLRRIADYAEPHKPPLAPSGALGTARGMW
jgi:hypothetical protein